MKLTKSSWLLLAIFLLASCGENNGETGSDSGSVQQKLKVIGTSEQLTAYLKDAMLRTYSVIRPVVIAADETNAPASADSFTGSGENFSTTNTQEAQVDELDRLKNDGQYLYTSLVSTPSIQAYDTSTSQAILSDELTLNTQNERPLSGLYLFDTQLIALAGNEPYYWDFWFDTPYWMGQSTELFFIETANGQLTEQSSLKMDGQLISSRRVGSTLYLVTRHTPSLPELIAYPMNQDEVDINRDIIQAATFENILPTYSLNGVDQGSSLAATDCFITESSTDITHPNIISVLAINLHDSSIQPASKCFIGNAEALYASTSSLYLATTQGNYTFSNNLAIYPSTFKTSIHKFSLSEMSIDYRGSTEVDGHLGWQQNRKSFRMGEHEGVLRLITYTGNEAGSNVSPATLYTLEEDNNSPGDLKILAKLPNESRPDPLGKPGEQIYATRFIGNKGYLVTFRVIDPLYVLDLSDPADPFIAGELEVNGYSDYLHPVSENLILGIGKDAIPADDSFGDGRGAWYQGVKLALYNVSDPQNPVEADQVILGKRGTNTTVSYNHHAFTSLSQDTTMRLAIPVSLHDSGDIPAADSPFYFHRWQHDGLYRFNLDLVNETITSVAPVISSSPDSDSYSSIYNDRSVLIGDMTHYLNKERIISQRWE